MVFGRCPCDGRDALPARTAAGLSDAHIRCSASDRVRVPARPGQHVHRRVPDMRRRTRRIYHPRRYTGHDQRTSLTRIKRERVPTSTVARNAFQTCDAYAAPEGNPYLRRTAERLGIFPVAPSRGSITGSLARLCALPNSHEPCRRWECLVLRRIV